MDVKTCPWTHPSVATSPFLVGLCRMCLLEFADWSRLVEQRRDLGMKGGHSTTLLLLSDIKT